MKVNQSITSGSLETLSTQSWMRILPNMFRLGAGEFEALWSMHPRTYDRITLFGKTVKLPRYQCLYGEGIEYRYSGSTVISKPIQSPLILQLQDWIHQQEPDFRYNGVLVNWYRDGSHYVGAHSDDERCLVGQAPIYSFSFGDTRVFRISPKRPQRHVARNRDYPIPDGTIVIMGGQMQAEFKHAIVKTTRPVGRRVNLTFRAFKT